MSDQPANGSGGGFSTLDPTNPKDQAMIRKVAERAGSRWPITSEARAKVVAGLEKAMDAADALLAAGEARDGGNLHASVAKTFAVLDKLNQADEHLADKNERLDSGKATERVQGAVIVALPPGISGDTL